MSHVYTLYLEYICYDDGCHLRKFARHPTRRNITVTAEKLASVEIVVDKMHMSGHVDKWCLTNCDPHLFRDLDNVCRHMLHTLYNTVYCAYVNGNITD